MKTLPFSLAILILAGARTLFAQTADDTRYDSLVQLSPQGIKDYFDKGHDVNEPIGQFKTPAFQVIARSWGFYCDSTFRESVFYMVRKAKKPIENPLFFMIDPCSEHSKDIMEYFALLRKYKYKITEDDFGRGGAFFSSVDTRDRLGKTQLMYASEFGFKSSVVELLQGKPNVNLIDNDGKTALMYAAANGNAPVIKLLLANGANKKLVDKNGKKAADYGKSTDIKRALK